MEDLGHKVPQGSSGYREDGEFLREEARPSLALSLVTSEPCRSIQLLMVCVGGHAAVPTPAARWTRGSRRPPPIGTSPLSSLSLQNCHCWRPSFPSSCHFLWNSLLACQAIWICAAIENSVNDVPFPKGWGREVGAEGRSRNGKAL